jgi:hypothetical protein
LQSYDETQERIMKQIQITKRVRTSDRSQEIDTRTPSGRTLPF